MAVLTNACVKGLKETHNFSFNEYKVILSDTGQGLNFLVRMSLTACVRLHY